MTFYKALHTRVFRGILTHWISKSLITCHQRRSQLRSWYRRHFVYLWSHNFSNNFGLFSSPGFRNKFQEILWSCSESNYGHKRVPKGAMGDHSPLIHNKCYVSRRRLSNASHATDNTHQLHYGSRTQRFDKAPHDTRFRARFIKFPSRHPVYLQGILTSFPNIFTRPNRRFIRDFLSTFRLPHS